MNKDNMFHIIDKDKLLKTMSSKREGIIAETSPLYEWVDGWTDYYDEWLNAFENLSNETKTQNNLKAALELRPLFVKPKTKARTLDDVIDEMLYCKNCGAYVCYLTEHNAKDEYKYCHHCGKLLNWDDVSMSEDYRKLEEIKE